MKITCRKCSSIVEVKHLNMHMKYIHGIESGFAYFCPNSSCDRKFSSAKSLSNHVRKLNHSLLNENENFGENNLSVATAECSRSQCTTHTDTMRFQNHNNLNVENSTELFTKKDVLHQELLNIISGLYADSSLTRVQIQNFIDCMQGFVQDSYGKFIINICENFVKDNSDKKEIETQVADLNSVFEAFSTEHKRINQLISHKGLIKPQEKLLGYREGSNTLGVLENIKITCQFIPLRDTLKSFLEIPNVFNIIQNYIDNLDSTSISNIVQSRYWNKQIDSIDGIVLPLFIYQDDFETGNPLGSRASIHKLSGVYANIACLPPQYFSKLDNIFLVQLHYSSDAAFLGNACVYRYLIEELNFLSNSGIKVNIEGNEVIVKFQLSMILGDNLGLNNILGFNKSFSARSYCRFCKMVKNVCQISTQEDVELLRNKRNYAMDLSEQNAETGVIENSIFNCVDRFHVSENYCVDIMHDLLEGICKNDLVNILDHFVATKVFSLNTLNYKIQYYNYPRNCNKPSIISLKNLQDKNLRMSASEMMVFTLHAGLIFGDLVPENNVYWELYKLLRKILVISLNSLVVSDGVTNLLSTLIEEHHNTYLKLFGDLKPKGHFCLHYPRIMRLVGPLRNFWSMRFEGKHRIFKQSARVTCNRQNLCLTLAMRHQQHLNYAFENSLAFQLTLDYKKLNTKISERYSKKISDSISGEFSLVAHIALGNVVYKIGTFIVIGVEDLPFFGCIRYILLTNNNANPVKADDFELVVEVYETLGKNDHLQTYVIPRTAGDTKIEILNFESIIHYNIPHVPYANVRHEVNLIYD